MNLAAPAISRGIARFIVIDTETTGVQRYDKIVTLAALCFEDDQIIQRSHYLIFDPRKDSHPEAEKIHGWCNWTTRFQDLFADHAAELRDWLSWGDRIVMHNAKFDEHYLQRDLRKAGQQPLDVPSHCTLEQARKMWVGQPCGLDHCLTRIGVPRRPGKRHNALQDAFLTAALYLSFTGKKLHFPHVEVWPMPRNYVVPDPRPAGELPRRAPKRAKSR